MGRRHSARRDQVRVAAAHFPSRQTRPILGPWRRARSTAIRRNIRKKTRPSRPAPRHRGRMCRQSTRRSLICSTPPLEKAAPVSVRRQVSRRRSMAPLFPPPLWGRVGRGVAQKSTQRQRITFPPPPLTPPHKGEGKAGGLKPPPDNSWDRRADFANAHRARKSTQGKAQGFEERPQSGYAARGPAAIDPELVSDLGRR